MPMLNLLKKQIFSMEEFHQKEATRIYKASLDLSISIVKWF